VRTYSAKPSDITKAWHIIDASSLVVGRLASEIARILKGKHKPIYTPHMDCGDNVVVINAAKVAFTGNKMARKDGKIYYRHTGYIGGIKETTAGKILEGAHPERVLQLAVKRMLSKNPLGKQQFSNLYVYAGESHPHAGQTPKEYDFASKNIKNKK
jgi:large subunit ribosomal protein L13